MSQFDFYGTWSDSWELLKIALKYDTVLIPDCWYEEPKPILFKDITDELKQLMFKKRRLFIWGKDFSNFEPGFIIQLSGPRKGMYSTGAEYGGPCLDLTLPACFERNDIINLSCGTLTYPKEYKNPNTSKWEKSSETIANKYKTIRKDFKKRLKEYRVGKYIWIGEDALALLQNGKAKIIDRG